MISKPDFSFFKVFIFLGANAICYLIFHETEDYACSLFVPYFNLTQKKISYCKISIKF